MPHLQPKTTLAFVRLMKNFSSEVNTLTCVACNHSACCSVGIILSDSLWDTCGRAAANNMAASYLRPSLLPIEPHPRRGQPRWPLLCSSPKCGLCPHSGCPSLPFKLPPSASVLGVVDHPQANCRQRASLHDCHHQQTGTTPAGHRIQFHHMEAGQTLEGYLYATCSLFPSGGSPNSATSEHYWKT